MRLGVTNANHWSVARGGLEIPRGSVPMLWSHDESEIIGKWSNVALAGDVVTVRGQLNLDVARAKEALSLLRAADVSGLSVGLSVEPTDVRRDGDAFVFERARLEEISVVAIPADRAARVSAVASVKSIRDFEAHLRSVGWPRAAAAKLAWGGWRALAMHHDSEEWDQLAARIADTNARLAQIRK